MSLSLLNHNVRLMHYCYYIHLIILQLYYSYDLYHLQNQYQIRPSLGIFTSLSIYYLSQAMNQNNEDFLWHLIMLNLKLLIFQLQILSSGEDSSYQLIMAYIENSSDMQFSLVYLYSICVGFNPMLQILMPKQTQPKIHQLLLLYVNLLSYSDQMQPILHVQYYLYQYLQILYYHLASNLSIIQNQVHLNPIMNSLFNKFASQINHYAMDFIHFKLTHIHEPYLPMQQQPKISNQINSTQYQISNPQLQYMFNPYSHHLQNHLDHPINP